MQIPKYWARGSAKAISPKGEHLAMECCGWSTESIVAAQRLADERSERALQAKVRGEELKASYLYDERPFREDIVKEFSNDSSSADTIITRNAYGSLVLNTTRAMFIDIDFKPVTQSLLDSIKSLFGGKSNKDKRQTQIEQELQHLESWLQNFPTWGVRVYETFAGLRYLITHETVDPSSAMVKTTMEALHADPLYAKLCESQGCFRARLTPKHWRLHLQKPPTRFPFQSEKDRSQFEQWLTTYESKSTSFSTCRYLKSIGTPRISPAIQKIIELHDEYTHSESTLALA